MNRRAVQIASLALIHFVVGFAAFMWTFSVGNEAFEGRPVSWLDRQVARPLSDALWFPAEVVADGMRSIGVRLPPSLQWVLLIGNSLVWGWFVTAVLTHLGRRRRPARAAGAGNLK